MAIFETIRAAYAVHHADARNVAEAMRNPNGWVYQIAGKFGPNDAVPPESIVGAFNVDENGNLAGEFQANPSYRKA